VQRASPQTLEKEIGGRTGGLNCITCIVASGDCCRKDYAINNLRRFRRFQILFHVHKGTQCAAPASSRRRAGAGCLRCDIGSEGTKIEACSADGSGASGILLKLLNLRWDDTRLTTRKLFNRNDLWPNVESSPTPQRAKASHTPMRGFLTLNRTNR
jgi:hypothetical protein